MTHSFRLCVVVVLLYLYSHWCITNMHTAQGSPLNWGKGRWWCVGGGGRSLCCGPLVSRIIIQSQYWGGGGGGGGVLGVKFLPPQYIDPWYATSMYCSNNSMHMHTFSP